MNGCTSNVRCLSRYDGFRTECNSGYYLERLADSDENEMLVIHFLCGLVLAVIDISELS